MKIISTVFCALLLAACAIGGRNGTAPTVFDFGMPAARISDGGQWSRLTVEVRAPQWLDAASIFYRLNYDDPLKLHAYTSSRWAGVPTQLVAQRLRQQLGANGRPDNTAAGCLLRFELQAFSQVFDTVQGSRGVLHGSLALFDAQRRPLASRQIAIEHPAATPDARGGVAALLATNDELGRQVAAWLDAQPAGGACRAGALQPG